MNPASYFHLTLDIAITPGQMMCSNCTTTITHALTKTLSTEFADDCYAPTSIQAYDCHSTPKKDLVSIETWFLPDATTSLVKLKNTCLKTINELGFDTLACTIYVNSIEIGNIELAIEEGKTTITQSLESSADQPIVTPLTLSTPPSLVGESLKGLGLLSLGGLLMTLDHVKLPFSGWLGLSIGGSASALSLWAARYYIRNAIQRRGAMDTLVSLACTVAIAYSFLSLYKNQPTFFDVPLMTLGFLRISHTLRKYIENLIKAQETVIEDRKNHLPLSALVLASNTLIPVSNITSETEIGVLPNTVVPIDGTLIEPEQVHDINESFLTGNQRLKTKRRGDTIYAGTLNSSQTLTLKTIHTLRESALLSRLAIIRQTEKQDALIEWVSRYFLIGVLSAAIASAACWSFLGNDASINRGCEVFLSILLSACPCGLGLISLNAPMIKLVALQQGILIKNLQAIEKKITDICIDKCGTATEGEYQLSKITVLAENTTEERLLNYAIMLQQQIPVPRRTAIAKAILKKGNLASTDQRVSSYTPYTPNPGRGGEINIDGLMFTMGNRALLRHFNITIPDHLTCPTNMNEAMHIYCAINKTIAGIFTFHPTVENEQILRPDLISTLKFCLDNHQSIHVLTGDDSAINAEKMANQFISSGLKVSEIKTGLLPEDKRLYIENLQNEGKTVLMIGDGENDIPAIEQADIGAAMNDQAPCSQDADVIFNDHFLSLIQLFSLSASYQQSHRLSLVLAFGINIILIALSAGVLYPLNKEPIDPMFIGMGMASSSLILVITIACWKKIAEQRIQPTREKPKNTCSWIKCSHLWRANTLDTREPLLPVARGR